MFRSMVAFALRGGEAVLGFSVLTLLLRGMIPDLSSPPSTHRVRTVTLLLTDIQNLALTLKCDLGQVIEISSGGSLICQKGTLRLRLWLLLRLSCTG